MTVFVEIASV